MDLTVATSNSNVFGPSTLEIVDDFARMSRTVAASVPRYPVLLSSAASAHGDSQNVPFDAGGAVGRLRSTNIRTRVDRPDEATCTELWHDRIVIALVRIIRRLLAGLVGLIAPLRPRRFHRSGEPLSQPRTCAIPGCGLHAPGLQAALLRWHFFPGRLAVATPWSWCDLRP